MSGGTGPTPPSLLVLETHSVSEPFFLTAKNTPKTHETHHKHTQTKPPKPNGTSEGTSRRCGPFTQWRPSHNGWCGRLRVRRCPAGASLDGGGDGGSNAPGCCDGRRVDAAQSGGTHRGHPVASHTTAPHSATNVRGGRRRAPPSTPPTPHDAARHGGPENTTWHARTEHTDGAFRHVGRAAERRESSLI